MKCPTCGTDVLSPNDYGTGYTMVATDGLLKLGRIEAAAHAYLEAQAMKESPAVISKARGNLRDALYAK